MNELFDPISDYLVHVSNPDDLEDIATVETINSRLLDGASRKPKRIEGHQTAFRRIYSETLWKFIEENDKTTRPRGSRKGRQYILRRADSAARKNGRSPLSLAAQWIRCHSWLEEDCVGLLTTLSEVAVDPDVLDSVKHTLEYMIVTATEMGQIQKQIVYEATPVPITKAKGTGGWMSTTELAQERVTALKALRHHNEGRDAANAGKSSEAKARWSEARALATAYREQPRKANASDQEVALHIHKLWAAEDRRSGEKDPGKRKSRALNTIRQAIAKS